MKLLPKTLSRIIKYRQLLEKYRYTDQPHVFSHDLARLVNTSPARVRQDLMHIGFHGNHRKGYHVIELLDLIEQTLRTRKEENIVVIGDGDLGKAVIRYFEYYETHIKIRAVFDVSAGKEKVLNVDYYNITELSRIIQQYDIQIAALALTDDAESISDLLISGGIRGILNFTPVEITVPGHVFLKQVNLYSMIEEIAYYLHADPG